VAHAYRRLRLVAGSERPSAVIENRTLAAVFNAAWLSLLGLTLAIAGKRCKRRPPRASPPDAVKLHPYSRFYERASDLSAKYMRTYRGGFVMSYLLAWMAVCAAVLAMAASIWTDGRPSHWFIGVLCILKIALLIVLLRMEQIGHREKLQEAAADFRYLAELLRPVQWLAPIGTSPPAMEAPIHLAQYDPGRSWMLWLARAIGRSTPPVAARTEDGWHYPREIVITREVADSALVRARMEWLTCQASYHFRTGRVMRALDEGLELLAKRLIVGVLAAAVLACLLVWLEEWHHVAVVASVVAAVVPALIAVIAGLRFQSEAKRLAMRSEAMYVAVREYIRALRNASATLQDTEPRLEGPGADAAQRLRAAAAGTIQEAGDWKVLYQVHGIPTL